MIESSRSPDNVIASMSRRDKRLRSVLYGLIFFFPLPRLKTQSRSGALEFRMLAGKLIQSLKDNE